MGFRDFQLLKYFLLAELFPVLFDYAIGLGTNTHISHRKHTKDINGYKLFLYKKVLRL